MGTQRKKTSEISLPLKIQPSTENLGKLAFGIFILIDGSPEVGVPNTLPRNDLLSRLYWGTQWIMEIS